MKGLRKVLTPFAPDQSGASGVLYSMGALIVIIDAGGCTGNVCGFDEPRSGTNVACAIKLAMKLGAGKTVVTVLPDTAERYFSTPLFEE